jgi:hypothetical protein
MVDLVARKGVLINLSVVERLLIGKFSRGASSDFELLLSAAGIFRNCEDVLALTIFYEHELVVGDVEVVGGLRVLSAGRWVQVNFIFVSDHNNIDLTVTACVLLNENFNNLLLGVEVRPFDSTIVTLDSINFTRLCRQD